ncbi:MAG: PASTA domain-containing protein [Bacteroidales bacterium]|nr:PASTA domain-containing protein [Bacteroidales bacterium]
MKKILLHAVLISVLAVLIVIAALSTLDRYTRHGQVFVIPDFVGADHEQIIDDYGSSFQFIIVDSVYDKSLPAGAVIQQDPFPGSKVKQGRNVYFIIVAQQPEQVVMPNLINLSIRQAIVSMETAGLEIDELSFTGHFARNAVVDQKFNGIFIEPGTLLYRGSKIELVLGDGGEQPMAVFPQIYGKSSTEAKRLLHLATLNVGHEYFLDDYDTLNGRVFKVEPYLLPGNEVEAANVITIWYRSVEKFDFEQFINDSLYIEQPDETMYENKDFDY